MSDSPIARDHLDGDYRNSKDMIIHARGVVYDLLSLNIDGFSDESDISAEEDMQLDFERLFDADADNGADGGDNVQLDHTDHGQVLDLPIAGRDGPAVQAGAPAPTSGRGGTATGWDQQGVGDRRSSNQTRTRRKRNRKRFRPYSNVTVSALC